ncbi:hypothetical protein PFISCL1PPCAC_22364, partial [Pristionchus fissidentatus]
PPPPLLSPPHPPPSVRNPPADPHRRPPHSFVPSRPSAHLPPPPPHRLASIASARGWSSLFSVPIFLCLLLLSSPFLRHFPLRAASFPSIVSLFSSNPDDFFPSPSVPPPSP